MFIIDINESALQIRAHICLDYTEKKTNIIRHGQMFDELLLHSEGDRVSEVYSLRNQPTSQSYKVVYTKTPERGVHRGLYAVVKSERYGKLHLHYNLRDKTLTAYTPALLLDYRAFENSERRVLKLLLQRFKMENPLLFPLTDCTDEDGVKCYLYGCRQGVVHGFEDSRNGVVYLTTFTPWEAIDNKKAVAYLQEAVTLHTAAHVAARHRDDNGDAERDLEAFNYQHVEDGEAICRWVYMTYRTDGVYNKDVKPEADDKDE